MANVARIQEKREKAQHLIAVRESPSYPILKQIIEKQINTEFKKFIQNPAVSQQGLDYARGYMYGMRYVLEVIERGEKMLEQSIAEAQALEGAEGDVA